MDILSKRLHDLRVDADLKQSTMASILNVSQVKISYFENGREPPLDVLRAYAEYFNVSVEYLMGISQEKRPLTSAGGKPFDAMQAAAVARDETPFTRADIVQLAAAFNEYYAAGAPGGSVPMNCATGFIKALTQVLTSAARGDAAALFLACDDVARAGMDISAVLGSHLGAVQNDTVDRG